MTEGAHLALAAWWRDTGERVAPSANALARVRDIESRYGLSLPEDFRNYLLETAPAEDLSDRAGMAWWPLDRVTSVAEQCNRPVEGTPADEEDSWLFFVDYMDWLWGCAICCSAGPDRGKIAAIGGGTPDLIIAASFSEFVEQYLQDPIAICGSDAGKERARRRLAARNRDPDHIPRRRFAFARKLPDWFFEVVGDWFWP